jgi:hypothetical protein
MHLLARCGRIATSCGIIIVWQRPDLATGDGHLAA